MLRLQFRENHKLDKRQGKCKKKYSWKLSSKNYKISFHSYKSDLLGI